MCHIYMVQPSYQHARIGVGEHSLLVIHVCPELLPDTHASLLSNQVIVTGADCYETGGEESGHEFLIDGYIRYRERIVSHYRWIYDPPMLIPEDDMEVIVYSSPEIELIKMNWGWNNSDDDDASFAITGSWSLDDGTCYDHDFTMIYNFAVKDE